MANEVVYAAGSAGLFVAYLLAVDTGAYVVQKPDGSAPAAAIATDFALRLDGTTDQTAFTTDSNGVGKIVLSNYNVSSAIISFLNQFAKDTSATASSTTPPSFVNERGVKQGIGLTGPSGRPRVVWMSYGPPGDGATDSTKRLMLWGVGEVDMSSGPLTWKDGTLVKPDITINGIKAEYDVTILEELLDGTYLKVGAGGVGDIEIPQYSPFEREYLLKNV